MGPLAGVLADLHAHAHGGSAERLYDCLDVLKWASDSFLQAGCKHAFFLGDLFQEKAKIHTLAYHSVYQTVRRYAEKGLSWHIILGNHDIWQNNNWDVNTVQPLDAIPGVRVIDKPMSYEVEGRLIDWMPYSKDPARHLLSLGEADLLLGHLSLAEARYSIGHTQWASLPVECEADMEKLESERLGRWDKVVLGHIHMAQKIGNAEYIGSPLELRSDEAGVEKHIGIMDLSTLEMHYIVNSFSPRHMVISENDLSTADIDNNFVTVVMMDAGTTSVADLKMSIPPERIPRRIDFVESPRPDNPMDVDQVYKVDVADASVLRKWIRRVGANGLNEDVLVEVAESICQHI